jgi:hypothetical protein
MKIFIISLGIGLVAGAIDIMPMIKQKINPYSIAAIFVQWLWLGLLLPYINLGINMFLEGLVLGILAMLPFFLQVLFRNKKAAPKMLVFAGIMGIAMNVVFEYLSK